MALREFIDGHGRTWQVWDTRPGTSAILGTFTRGWLTFEHEALRRRLTPIPEGWDLLSDDALAQLCVEAVPEPPRKRLIE